jgi:hypothetical protein
MAITVNGTASTVVGGGSTGTAVGSATPTLPTGTAIGTRVFIFANATHQLSIPASWTQVMQQQLGGGTYGAAAGPRWLACFYRDRDTTWTMPAVVTTASVPTPTVATYAISLAKGAGESFATPDVAWGSQTTASTSLNVTGGNSITTVSGGHWMVCFGWPSSAGALTTPVLSFNGTNQTPITTNPGTGQSTSGNDAYIGGRTIPVVTVGTAAPIYTATQNTAATVGLAFVHQGAGTVASSPIATQINVNNRAVVRAASW